MIKVSLDDLKKAVKWIEANTVAVDIHVEEVASSLKLRTVDKQGQIVSIEVYDAERSKLFPKITKTERLT